MQRLDKESIQTAVSLEIYINPRLKMYQTLPSFLQNFFPMVCCLGRVT